MTRFSDLKNKWMQDPAFRAEYEALEAEFRLADALIRARASADMTQADVAQSHEHIPVLYSAAGGRKHYSVV